MRKKRFVLLLTALLAVVLALSGCSGLFPAAQEVPQPELPAETETEPAVASETPEETGQAPSPTEKQVQEPEEATAADSGSPTETAAPTAAAVQPRQGLEASDPTSAVLASGQVQLVEFFAFW